MNNVQQHKDSAIIMQSGVAQLGFGWGYSVTCFSSTEALPKCQRSGDLHKFIML